ncbi:2-oxoglutarate dehydrogenase E1 component [Capnocytophaga canis]|uniref:oxoglutarate dehydrogenase (succinyl-transferring) n=1 Tax=Capnocytophaga canis TaxID=1848903 RepID=A0A0B7I138_9FLAO|nr:2-oxoglutarate dehydrogenase E1 component [Capnocytophaga canis]CEN44499.1 2-oxoglutarate dehydrogenase E1 component [Capnocytophaga canis]CEN52462.1 2-oxoglutarate dehydrogenase E1 component [Capnocytophaga canis]
MDKYSFLNAASTAYFGELYEKYLENPDAVEPSWRAFFQGFDFAQENYGGSYDQTVQVMAQSVDTGNSVASEKLQKEFKVLNLINAYRTYGHLFTKINPIREREAYVPNLNIENYGLSNADLDTTFDSAKEIGLQPTSLRNIISALNDIYCRSIGVEYTYIREPEIRKWIETRLFSNNNKTQFSKEEKIQILKKLNEATSFENFLHTKYVGQKRFSLEGNDALISGLDFLIQSAAEQGVEHLVLGMAHRGRLNVLANIFNKNPQDIFSEFDGKDYEMEDNFDGDVKYHLGISSELVTKSGKKINVNLAHNPSHLETVGAVIQGIARSKQDRLTAGDRSKVLPIAIHGDAAISGQGIVYEIMQMCQLDGFKTGGTVHIVVNNQVGFTTNYTDSRSTTYCTDIAKVSSSPVLHVNSDDAEAVVHAFLFALDFRMQFGSDVYIDLLGYRKYGHNEGDEPRFTQPKLYKIIGKHDNPRNIYAKQLIEEGVITNDFVAQIEMDYKSVLDMHLENSRKENLTVIKPFMQDEWKGFEIASRQKMLEKFDTSFDRKDLDELAKIITELPADKKFINKITKIISDRKEAYTNDNIDWGTAEHLAFATLLSEGFDVRLTGQDVERGTFSHRHAVVKTEDTEEEITLLNELKKHDKFNKGSLHIYNSLLSEYGVLGFEYGYALASPNTLTIWEAQFGDFSNGAQIMLDQYISCTEDKWKNQDGVVMLLPHGYEGQGSEHSSARIERYLQLCSDKNMYVANCTTPANFYHLLRRQMKTNFRKPLVVFTPKSLLRHPQVVSKAEDLANGHFQEVIDDPIADVNNVKSVVFCSGRFYYDLYAEREKLGRNDVALIRIEQLFPLPVEQIKAILSKYKNADDYVWAQEEPKNMGAYGYMLMFFDFIQWRLASNTVYSAPASGSHTRDRKRHAEAIAMVFDRKADAKKNF